MSKTYDVAVLVGSLRQASITRKAALGLIAAAPSSLKCRLVGIDMPLYNEDLEASPPPTWTTFRQEMTKAEAVLLVTPEYNRSLSAAIKNAVDVGSRPYAASVWNGKPGAVASVSPFKLGAFGANLAVRQSLIFVNVPVMQQPEAYIGGAAELFADDGTVQNAETRQFLEKFMTAFADWVGKLAPTKG